jgi:hypothetical protein
MHNISHAMAKKEIKIIPLTPTLSRQGRGGNAALFNLLSLEGGGLRWEW